MKRIVFALLLSLSSTLLQIPANAATEGCPDTWEIDLNQYPNQELLSAKEKNGINMIITENRKMLSFKGELGDLPEISGLTEVSEGYGHILYYLYGKSLVEISTKVEVKNCPTKIFIFQSDWLQGVNFNSITALSWANRNPQAFKDFRQQENFAKVIDEVKLSVQSRINLQISSSQKFGTPLEISSQVLNNFISEKVKLEDQSIRAFALTPECLKPQFNGYPSDYRLIFGKECQFAFGVYKPIKPFENSISLFESFKLDLRVKPISITCIKGKLSKKVTAVSPKCPAGYKKK
jgi:hypothetical protein